MQGHKNPRTNKRKVHFAAKLLSDIHQSLHNGRGKNVARLRLVRSVHRKELLKVAVLQLHQLALAAHLKLLPPFTEQTLRRIRFYVSLPLNVLIKIGMKKQTPENGHPPLLALTVLIVAHIAVLGMQLRATKIRFIQSSRNQIVAPIAIVRASEQITLAVFVGTNHLIGRIGPFRIDQTHNLPYHLLLVPAAVIAPHTSSLHPKINRATHQYSKQNPKKHPLGLYRPT